MSVPLKRRFDREKVQKDGERGVGKGWKKKRGRVSHGKRISRKSLALMSNSPTESLSMLGSKRAYITNI